MSKEFLLDWEKYLEKARQAISEGCVLLKNDNNTLPLPAKAKVSVFGRIALHYYKSGTGSGGMVNVSKVTGILDALKESSEIELNKNLMEIYEKWDKENPIEEGQGWGQEPWFQEEMPLDDKTVSDAKKESDYAIVIIGRSAGEDKDAQNTEGSYKLTQKEETMIEKVCAHFEKVIVLLNVGSLIDMSFVQKYNPSAVMYVWQGGMIGGYGVVDLLTGKANPSGKLTDTIAYNIEDYPSHKNFGDRDRNIYQEDIYVGYRYFETFAKDKVMYPFGFGLSYSSFQIDFDLGVNTTPKNGRVKALSKACLDRTYSADKGASVVPIVNCTVKNTGNLEGKEVLQLYVEAPQGKLGKPSRALCAFEKSDLLKPNESQKISFEVSPYQIASYDDSGITGKKSAYVLEAGKYNFYVGSDVRSAKMIYSFEIPELIVVEQLTEALAATTDFERFKPIQKENSFEIGFEKVPTFTYDMDQKRLDNLPKEIAVTEDKGIKLSDVKLGKATLDDFIAQLTDDDLSCIIRGEGMGSLKVTLGTASAFGGVSPHLQELGIPCACCDDGPSGMRLDSGVKAFSLPNGTLLACTFNKKLNTELYSFTAMEMVHNKVECLLGPGMNIHRHPLNGRNFEYFSEDPFVTGEIGAAQILGMNTMNVTGTIKHFCGNNQETRRHNIDSIVSERALREIYLKGFETAVKKGKATSVMTTYGSVNGRWTAGSYDLNTTILRNEWGFKGVVMTDWYASINEFGKPEDKTNFAAMVRSQNDLYMVCPDGSFASTGDNTLQALSDGRLTRAELQRSAKNVCSFLLDANPLARMMKTADTVKIINRPEEEATGVSSEELEIIHIVDAVTIPLDTKDSTKPGTDYAFAIELEKRGMYKVSVTGSSELGELAQLPITIFVMGIPTLSLSFTGTNGKEVTLERPFIGQNNYAVFRLNVAQAGLKLKEMKLEYLRPFTDEERSKMFW